MIKTLNSKLANELERLKRISGLGLKLEIVWKPRTDGTLSGEVRNQTIYVYDIEEEKAVETLRHEFLDYCVSQIVEPYKRVANSLISMINEEVYRTKEGTVEGFVKLLCTSRDERR